MMGVKETIEVRLGTVTGHPRTVPPNLQVGTLPFLTPVSPTVVREAQQICTGQDSTSQQFSNVGA